MKDTAKKYADIQWDPIVQNTEPDRETPYIAVALGRFQFELRHHNGNTDRLEFYNSVLTSEGVDCITPIAGSALQEYYAECKRADIEPEL